MIFVPNWQSFLVLLVFSSNISFSSSNIVGHQGLSILSANLLDDVLLDIDYNAFLYTDSYGYTWISSAKGLNRYNGSISKHYPLSEYDIKGSSIQSGFVEDSLGNIWFTTYEYLVFYNRGKDEFESYQFNYNGEPLNNWNYIVGIDPNKHKILVSSSNRFVIFDSMDPLNYVVSDELNIGRRFYATQESGNSENVIYSCPWIEDKSIQIYSWNDWSLEFVKEIDLESKNLEISEVLTTERNIWLASNRGIVRIDKNDNIEIVDFSGSDYRVNSIKGLNKSMLIVSIEDFGLYIYNIEKDEFTNLLDFYRPIFDIKDSPKNVYLKDNVLWASYYGYGVGIFKNINELVNPKRSLIYEAEVLSMTVMDSTIIFATQEKIEKRGMIEICDDDWSSRSLEGIKQISNNGEYIIGIANSSFYSIDICDGEVSYENISSSIYYLEEKIQWIDRTELLFTSNEGPVLYNTENRKLEKLTSTIPADFNINRVSDVVYLLDDLIAFVYDKNSLIITDSGIVEYEKSESSYVNTVVTNYNDEYLAICKVDGLDLVSISSEKNISVTTIVELKGVQIYDCVFKNEFLYVLSKNSVHRYDIKVGKVDQALNHANIGGYGSSFQITNNRIIVGGKKGILSYDVSSVKEYDPPFIDIERIMINDREKYLPWSNISFNYLNHSQKHIKIKPSVITMEPEVSKILYQLEGPHSLEGVITSGEEIELYFENYGTYNVALTPIDENRFIGESLVISFIISPPYYQTWWFRSASVLGLLGIGFGINYNITRRRLKAAQIQLDKQKALSTQREKIADDLHDELGTELSKILYLSDEAVETRDTEKKEGLVREITSLAAGSISNMKDMLWVLEQKNDTLESLVAKLRRSIRKTLKGYPLSVKFDIPATIPEVTVVGETRKEILLIVKEATHNVIKHAEAKSVIIRVRLADNELEIGIMDDGVGIMSESEFATKGRGLGSMKKRAEKIGGRLEVSAMRSGGTKVLLSVTNTQVV